MFSHVLNKREPLEIAVDDPKTCRKTLKTIQHQEVQKENLTIRKGLKPVEPEKKKTFETKAVQTGEDFKPTFTADDLVNETATDDYWRALAVQRGVALDNSLQENEKLQEQVDHWKRESEAAKSLLEESRSLVNVLEELLDSAGNADELDVDIEG
ncbi:geminin isoform X2 [Atheta coriaria]|uniref:geminin isoform X2 n=1 Tax=Dalotia coriaria TaxID=877792 RepID=UPI0031F45EBE